MMIPVASAHAIRGFFARMARAKAGAANTERERGNGHGMGDVARDFKSLSCMSYFSDFCRDLLGLSDSRL